MKFLVVYGTTEGQTRKICEFVADRIKAQGHDVTLLDATSKEVADHKIGGYEGVIVAASLHAGLFQTAVEEFARERRDMLSGIRTMFLPVSLSAASSDPEDLAGLQQCVQRFLERTSWKPGETHNVIGAFRYTQYDFFKRWGMRMIARQKGVSTDTSRDLEMTNWPELASLTDAFVATVVKAKNR